MWLLVTSTTTRLSLSVLFLYCFCYVSLWKSGLYWCTIANRFSISEALVKIPFANGKQNSCCPLLSQIPTCLCRAVLLPARRRRQGRGAVVGWLTSSSPWRILPLLPKEYIDYFLAFLCIDDSWTLWKPASSP